MSNWPSVKAKRLLVALFGIGWKLKRQSGSHRTLAFRPKTCNPVSSYCDADAADQTDLTRKAA
jgi:hypothetical protein